MTAVRLDYVTKVYPGGVRALSEGSFEVDNGELVVVLGPSGCGKTTLLRLTAGLERLSHGSIQIGGKVMDNVPPARRGVAMAFQSPALFPQWSVRRNIRAGCAKGCFWDGRDGEQKKSSSRTSAREDRIARIAAELQITALLDRRPDELSGGEQQRAALARTLASGRRLILLDEPLAHLDAPLRGCVRRVIKTEQARSASTVMYVTHDQEDAMTLADRLVVLRDGKVRQIGEKDEVYHRPANAFVARFLGSPPMNLIHGRLALGSFDAGLTFQASGWSVNLGGRWLNFARRVGVRPIMLGVRAEDVRSARQGGSVDEFDGNGRFSSPLVVRTSLVEALGGHGAAWLIPVEKEANPPPDKSGNAFGNSDRAGDDGDAGTLAMRLGQGVPPPALGETIEVVFDIAKLHWFDSESGERLTEPANRDAS